VLAAVPGYVQNHTVLPEQGTPLSAPFKTASERDSVIELKFDGTAGIDRLLSVPSYLQHVRPDEALFNDLPHNIMVLTEPSTAFRAPSVGRCKRFDFIRRVPGTDASTFRAETRKLSQALAIDPLYTAHVDRHVDRGDVRFGRRFRGRRVRFGSRSVGNEFCRSVSGGKPFGPELRRPGKVLFGVCRGVSDARYDRLIERRASKDQHRRGGDAHISLNLCVIQSAI